MQASITVFLPKGRSGLNAPIRSERPAARRIAPKVLGLWSLVFELSTLERHYQRFESKNTKTQGQRPKSKVQRPKTKGPRPKTAALCGCQFSQRAKRVLPRHLLAPVHHEVGVVERARFDVSSFGCGLDVIVIEWVSDQCLSCFLHLQR